MLRIGGKSEVEITGMCSRYRDQTIQRGDQAIPGMASPSYKKHTSESEYHNITGQRNSGFKGNSPSTAHYLLAWPSNS